jgi:hypothetical protein
LLGNDATRSLDWSADGRGTRDYTDDVIVFGETHLHRIMSTYATYYNQARPHLSLGKGAPVNRPIDRIGRIVAQPMGGGLHHRYARI